MSITLRGVSKQFGEYAAVTRWRPYFGNVLHASPMRIGFNDFASKPPVGGRPSGLTRWGVPPFHHREQYENGNGSTRPPSEGGDSSSHDSDTI